MSSRRDSGRRGSVTTRAALLGLAISALAVLLALPLRTYLGQRSDIAATQAAQAAQRHRIAVLARQVSRDQDPAYVEQQARARLQLVKPNETDYVVITPPKPKPAPAKVGTSTALVPASAGDQTWYGALWGSVTVAGTTEPTYAGAGSGHR